MNTSSFSATFSVEQTPDRVFDAINDARGWWSGEIEGDTVGLGAEFTYRFGDVHYSRQRITEFTPGKRVVWHVLDANLSFLKDKGEWKGTDIVFEIARVGARTEVRFTHDGLVSANECYEDCSTAWSKLVKGNLRKLITTGEPQPSPW